MSAARRHYGITSAAAVAGVLFIASYALQLPFFDAWADYRPLLQRVTLSAALIAVVLSISRVVARLVDARVGEEGLRYNLLRINRLLALVFIGIVVASFLFQNLYGVVASLGLISLILGFALQAPIASFIAWLYVVFRRPYQVGDRIEIEGLRGDVREIGYLETKLEEISGLYLRNDRRSGRVVYFPNSLILRAHIINYSGQLGAFIWNETALPVAFTSDLAFVEACLLEAAKEDFRARFPKRPEADNEAAVYFRVSERAWLEAVVSYPVEPEDTTGRRNRILQLALPKLNAEPGRVGFPERHRR